MATFTLTQERFSNLTGLINSHKESSHANIGNKVAVRIYNYKRNFGILSPPLPPPPQTSKEVVTSPCTLTTAPRALRPGDWYCIWESPNNPGELACM